VERGEEAWRGVWLGRRVQLGRCEASGAEDGPARLRLERGGEREWLASRPRKAGQPATAGRIQGKKRKNTFPFSKLISKQVLNANPNQFEI